MPSINMIASRRSEKQRFGRNARGLMVVVLVEVVLGIALGGMFTFKICDTKRRIADLDMQLQRLRPTVKKIEDYETATAKLEPKVQLLQEAQGKTLRWRNLLDKLATALPAQTWLTKLGSTTSTDKDEGEPAIINIAGVSVSQNQVGEAMLRLNTYADFKSVDLHYTQGSSVGTRKTVEFELAAALKDDKVKEGTTSDNRKS
jgi:Tfp pilus assembly protein PilN